MLKRLLLALSFLAFATPLAAQWQVPNNTIPIGRGAGVTGFNSAAGAGTGAQCLIDTTPPRFGPCSGEQMFFANKAAIQAASIPAGVDMVTSLGYTTSGDNGGASYTRTGAGPATVWRFQSADGQWWVINNKTISPEMFACIGDGTTNDTACWNTIGTYITTISPGATLENRPGASYKIWPAATTPNTLLTLNSLNGFTWNFRGSCFTTDQVFVNGYGVAQIANSSRVIINNPCYRNTAWTTLSFTVGAVFFAIQEVSAPWTSNVQINNLYMNGGIAALRVLGGYTASSATWVGGDANNIRFSGEVENVFYGMTFQGSGDNFHGTLKASNTGRAYFPWNVSNHWVEVIANGGTLQQIDMTVYCYPNMSIARRMLSNINVTYRLPSQVAAFAAGEVSSQNFQQSVAPVTVSNAVNNGSGRVRLTVNSTADMLSGQTWFFNSITGTTEANGHNVITVVNATTVDLPNVNFVNAYISGGYGNVPGTMKDIRVKFDVINDFSNGNTLISQSKIAFPSTIGDTVTRGYEMSNIEISGSLRGYNNATPALRIFEAAGGSWTGESINNFSIRDMVITGTAGRTVVVNAPNATNTINLENIVSNLTWTLGGVPAGMNIQNVLAGGVTDRNTIQASTAPANQFANAIDANGLIAYGQPAVSGLSGLGSGVATALAVNVGSAGAPVVQNGALGSPSSVGTMPAFTMGGAIAGAGQSATGFNQFQGTTTRTSATTVGNLGACGAGQHGTRRGVTDATVTTFATTVVGGGANAVPVYCNGTNWIIG